MQLIQYEQEMFNYIKEQQVKLQSDVDDMQVSHKPLTIFGFAILVWFQLKEKNEGKLGTCTQRNQTNEQYNK